MRPTSLLNPCYQTVWGNTLSVEYNTIRASTSAAGSWACGWAGLQAGGGLGSLIGGPLAVIGGIIGGVGGAFGGSAIGEFAVDKMYGIR